MSSMLNWVFGKKDNSVRDPDENRRRRERLRERRAQPGRRQRRAQERRRLESMAPSSQRGLYDGASAGRAERLRKFKSAGAGARYLGGGGGGGRNRDDAEVEMEDRGREDRGYDDYDDYYSEDGDEEGDEDDGSDLEANRRGRGRRRYDNNDRDEDVDGKAMESKYKQDQESEDEETEQLRIQREEERKRREKLEEEAENAKEPIFQGAFPYSPERQAASWNFIKFVMFALLMIAGFYIKTFNYEKKTCYTGEYSHFTSDLCMFDNLTNYCTGREEVAACQNKISVANCNGSQDMCMFKKDYRFGERHPVNDTLVECLYGTADSGMPEACRENNSCNDDAESGITNAIIVMALIYMFLTVFELIMGVGLNIYAGWHADDFRADMSKGQKMLFICTKNGMYCTQAAWVFMIVVQLYLFYTVYGAGATCKNNITKSGAKSSFYYDVSTFTMVSFAAVVGFGIIGTKNRHRLKFRGELFNPSNDGALKVPMGIDCAGPNSREGPTCCAGVPRVLPKLWEGMQSLCSCTPCTKRLVFLVGWLFDCLCAPFLWMGRMLGWCWKHRHFIGP